MTNSDETRKNVERVVDLIMEKKGEDILVLDLSDITTVSDFFIITTGNSNVHIKAIADEIREKMKKEYGVNPWHVEGYTAQKWVLLDYVDFVVHIFDAETRTYYSLEKIWKDAQHRMVKTNY